VLVTTARNVFAVALGEPASDEATFNQPAARNTTLDNPRRRTAINRRPTVRLLDIDFAEEFDSDVTDASEGAGLGVDVGVLGGDVGVGLGDGCGLGGGGGLSGGGGGGASDINELVLREIPHLGDYKCAVIPHRVAPKIDVAES
jgi:hypothetical protein